MNPYSEDLRRKIIEAPRRGAGKIEAARLFGVSLSSVKCYAKMADEGYPLASKKPGSQPKIGEDAKRLLEAGLEGRPAATLCERREHPRRVAGGRVGCYDGSFTELRLHRLAAWTEPAISRPQRPAGGRVPRRCTPAPRR